MAHLSHWPTQLIGQFSHWPTQLQGLLLSSTHPAQRPISLAPPFSLAHISTAHLSHWPTMLNDQSHWPHLSHRPLLSPAHLSHWPTLLNDLPISLSPPFSLAHVSTAHPTQRLTSLTGPPICLAHPAQRPTLTGPPISPGHFSRWLTCSALLVPPTR